MALFIRVSGEETEVRPANGNVFTLSELQEFVGGSVQIIYIGRKLYAIDEEGKLNKKPHNVKATHRAHDFLYPGDFLAGDVLICDRSELESA